MQLVNYFTGDNSIKLLTGCASLFDTKLVTYLCCVNIDLNAKISKLSVSQLNH